MEDFEFCKCQASSAVVHLGSFIAGAAESAVPILDPLSGSLRVSTRDELDITFDTGVRPSLPSLSRCWFIDLVRVALHCLLYSMGHVYSSLASILPCKT
jgi:hypothetical protein